MRALEKAPTKEVINVDAVSENVVHIYSAIEELRWETEDGWKKLAVVRATLPTTLPVS